MTVASIRTAMGTALRTISGLRVSDYFTAQILPPHALFDFSIEPHMVFARGADVYRFRIQVYVSQDSLSAGQKFLDLLRDPSTTTSLGYVLETDATLAAAVDYVRITSVGEVEPVIGDGNTAYLSVTWEAEVVL